MKRSKWCSTLNNIGLARVELATPWISLKRSTVELQTNDSLGHRLSTWPFFEELFILTLIHTVPSVKVVQSWYSQLILEYQITRLFSIRSIGATHTVALLIWTKLLCLADSIALYCIATTGFLYLRLILTKTFASNKYQNILRWYLINIPVYKMYSGDIGLCLELHGLLAHPILSYVCWVFVR